MMIIIFIMSDIQVLAQLPRNLNYQPFSSNLNDVKFQKEFTDASTSFKTLLNKKADSLGTRKNASIRTVFESSAGGLKQDRILVEFADHSNPKFKHFSETLQSAYDICIEKADFDALWVNPDGKRNLLHNALALLEEKIAAVVKKQSVNKDSENSTNVGRNILTLLRVGKLYRKRKDNGSLVLVRDTNDLATFFTKCQDDASIADMDITRENRYLLLYKKTNGMFPLKEDINCKDWDEIGKKAPDSTPSDATAIVTETARMAVGVADLTKEIFESRTVFKKYHSSSVLYLDFHGLDTKKRFDHPDGLNINFSIRKSKMELQNQVKLCRLRKDDKRYHKCSRKLYDATCLSTAKDLDTSFDTKDVDASSSTLFYDDEGIVIVLKDNYVQVQAWYFSTYYKFLDAKVLHWISFDHRRKKTSSATPLLASTSTNLSSKRFFLLLVSNLYYDKSVNQRLGGGLTTNQRLGMARLFHSIMTRDPAKLSQLHSPDDIIRVAILERASPNEADQDIYSEGTFPAHLRAVHDQSEGSSSFSCYVSSSQQPNGQVGLLKDIVMDLDDELTQNEYNSKSQNGEAIKNIAICERSSPNQADQDIYPEGIFPDHLCAVHDQCEGSSFLSRSTSFSQQLKVKIKEIIKKECASPNCTDQINYTSGIFLAHLRSLDARYDRSSSSSRKRSNSFSRRDSCCSTNRLHALEQELETAIQDNFFLHDPESCSSFSLQQHFVPTHRGKGGCNRAIQTREIQKKSKKSEM